jgi:hypothetical protein
MHAGVVTLVADATLVPQVLAYACTCTCDMYVLTYACRSGNTRRRRDARAAGTCICMYMHMYLRMHAGVVTVVADATLVPQVLATPCICMHMYMRIHRAHVSIYDPLVRLLSPTSWLAEYMHAHTITHTRVRIHEHVRVRVRVSIVVHRTMQASAVATISAPGMDACRSCAALADAAAGTRESSHELGRRGLGAGRAGGGHWARRREGLGR